MPRFVRSRRTARVSRPTDRLNRAGPASLVVVGQTYQGFVYTATVPQTIMNIKLDIGPTILAAAGAIAYALVVVPEGYSPNNLIYPAVTGDLYNPTNMVLLSGVLTDNTIEDHKFLKIGRKLKTGDRICLLAMSPNVANSEIAFELSASLLF